MRHAIVVIFILICTSLVYAQDSTVNHIDISAQVEITAKADRAIFSFTVNGTGSTLRSAVDSAKTRINTITDGLKQIGLDESNFSTSRFHSSETKSKKAFIFTDNGYKTSISVTVNLDDMDLLEDAILYLSDIKPDHLSDINFVLHDYEQIRMDALKKAITKAKQKADLIAEIMGAELGELIYFKETTVNNGQIHYRGSRSVANAIFEEANLGNGSGSVFFSPDRKIISSVVATIAVKGVSKSL